MDLLRANLNYGKADSYLCFVQTSGAVIDWQKTRPTSASAGSTCIKRGADFDSTPLRAFS